MLTESNLPSTTGETMDAMRATMFHQLVAYHRGRGKHPEQIEKVRATLEQGQEQMLARPGVQALVADPSVSLRGLKRVADIQDDELLLLSTLLSLSEDTIDCLVRALLRASVNPNANDLCDALDELESMLSLTSGMAAVMEDEIERRDLHILER